MVLGLTIVFLTIVLHDFSRISRLTFECHLTWFRKFYLNFCLGNLNYGLGNFI